MKERLHTPSTNLKASGGNFIEQGGLQTVQGGGFVRGSNLRPSVQLSVLHQKAEKRIENN
jgi:hypothetical protein